MSELSAYSDCLDLPAAKKLFSSLQKPGKIGTWTDWSGEGGSETEEKEASVPAPTLPFWKVPDFCSSYTMTVSRELRSCSSLPSEFLIGGDSFILPEYGDYSCFDFSVVIREINYPIRFGLFKMSGCRHYGRKFNECCELSLIFPENESSEPEGLNCGPFPEANLSLQVVAKLCRKFGIPLETDPGIIERSIVMSAEMGGFSFRFETSRYVALKRCLREMLGELLADSPDKNYRIGAQVTFGGAAKFEGELHNVSPVIRELLPLVQAVNDYPAYDLTYYPLGPRSWKDREKSRKKWKKPIHEELGTATLENGTVAKVSLAIEKEGYVFFLNFDNDDDYIKFYHSKLFQKTQWHSGAE